MRRARARSRERHPQPVLRVRELPRPLCLHGAGASRASSSDARQGHRALGLAAFVAASGSAGTLGAGDYLKDGARREDRRRRGARVPDHARERLRRAQHPGHRRQAHPVHPQRHEHRRRDRRLATAAPMRSTCSSTARWESAISTRRRAARRRALVARLDGTRPLEHRQSPGRDQDGEAPRLGRDDAIVTVATDSAAMYGSERAQFRGGALSARLR